MSIVHRHIWRSGQDQCLSADRSVESPGRLKRRASTFISVIVFFCACVFAFLLLCFSSQGERERKRFCAKYFGMFISASVIMNFVLACFVLHLCLHTVPVSSALEFPFRDNLRGSLCGL